jgi:hypothetical protein
MDRSADESDVHSAKMGRKPRPWEGLTAEVKRKKKVNKQTEW